MSDFQEAYYVSGNSIVRCNEEYDDIDADPRGLLLMWEEPLSWAKYIMGCDPSVGLTGWTRGGRISGDEKTDNGVIEVYRVDAQRKPKLKDGKPIMDPLTKEISYVYQDLQVAEFAAPLDGVEIARVCNVVGRIYAGSEGDQCELIYESYPGPGMLTTQELLRLNYANLWMWERIADGQAEQTDRTGWYSTTESQKILWLRSRRHLIGDKAIIRSKWCYQEYENAVLDPVKMRAKADYGFHDDRVQASNMCFWAGHKWTYNVERTSEVVSSAPIVDYQRLAPTIGEHRSFRDDWANAMDNWE